jgi:TPR repeat protein
MKASHFTHALALAASCFAQNSVTGTAEERSPISSKIALKLHDEACEHYFTDGPGRDLPLAFSLALQSAQMECREAQYTLGLMYNYGHGTAVNREESLNWFKRSAENGYPKAQCAYGQTLLKGYGNQKINETEGLMWLTKAAKNGNGKATFKIGYHYYSHNKYSKVIALDYAKRASELGWVAGDFLAAAIYSTGTIDILPGNKIGHLPADNNKSLTLYLSLAQPERLEKLKEQGEFSEETLYTSLVPIAINLREYETAFKYASISANLNHPCGMYLLGICYEEGYGCRPNMEKAMANYIAARDGGNENAASRIFEIEHPKAFVKCNGCEGRGYFLGTYEGCRACGGKGRILIRR